MLSNQIFKILFIFAVGYFALSIFMSLNQKNYIYFPNDQNFESCVGFENSEKLTKNKTRAYYTDTGSDILVVFYHGNAGSACDRAFVKDRFLEKGISTLIVEYSGYSGDDRDPSRELILTDVENINFLLDDLNQERFIYMGNSLGSGVAGYHSTLREPEKYIGVGSYEKLSSVAKKHYPFLPIDFLLTEEYETVEWLKNYSGKVLLLHGKEDNIVPVEYGKRLYESLNTENKEFKEIEGEGHNTVLGSKRLWEEVFDFVI